MQKAYGYLTNPTTRIIYDKFGVQGIKVYEMFSEEFREISEELRTQDLDEAKKKELESVSTILDLIRYLENREAILDFDQDTCQKLDIGKLSQTIYVRNEYQYEIILQSLF